MATNEDLIGRDDINDLEAILADHQHRRRRGHPRGEGQRRRHLHVGLREGQPAQLNSLYEKAKTSQWNGETDLPWDDRGRPGGRRRCANAAPTRPASAQGMDLTGTPFEKWGDKEWIAARRRVAELDAVSQFMHGEQGALVCTAKIVETVPWIDAKYYAADPGDGRGPPRRGVRQVPRHQALGPLPDQRPPAACCSTTSSHDSRWDMTYLGMQIMVEGLALAAFGFMHQLTTEPLLKQLLRYVMSDEARHVAFGVLSLQEYYAGADRRRAARAPGVRLRGRRAHARPLPAAGGVGAHGHRPSKEVIAARACRRPSEHDASSRCCSPRSCRTARSSACSTPATGWLRAAVHRARRHPVRGLGRHRRGVRGLRPRRAAVSVLPLRRQHDEGVGTMAIEEVDIRSGHARGARRRRSPTQRSGRPSTPCRAATMCASRGTTNAAASSSIKLYEKAKTSQWNVTTDIDWDIDVDPWKIARDPNNPLNTHDGARARRHAVREAVARTSGTTSAPRSRRGC